VQLKIGAVALRFDIGCIIDVFGRLPTTLLAPALSLGLGLSAPLPLLVRLALGLFLQTPHGCFDGRQTSLAAG
jgi:hypothetical protein